MARVVKQFRQPLRLAGLCLVVLAGLVVEWSLAASVTSAQPEWECPAPAPAGTSAPSATLLPAIDLDAPFPEEGGAVTVFAAASLTDAFEAIAADLEASTPGLTITFNFGGSPALVTQLREGAAADVFASANTTQMDLAADASLIAGGPVTFATNRLAIVTPTDNPAGIVSPVDLGGEDLRLVLAQPDVPAGRYAREAACAMAADTAAYGVGFLERVAANVVSEEEDVRDVLAKVALGEADAGIVYVSDAQSADSTVQTIAIPEEVNVVATYPIAPVSGGDGTLAAAFIAYVLGDEGQETLTEFGFEPAG